jgi:hypothetical protein
MDRYLTKNAQKYENDFPRVVCLVGKSGIGKTWAAHKALGPNLVELTSEILRSRHDTNEFLEKIRGTNIPVLLDEYETLSDLVGLRDLAEVPTLGQFIVTSQVVPKFDFEIEVREFPVKTFQEIKTLCPGATDENILSSKGDLRRVFMSLEINSDTRDDFNSPREFVTDLVSVWTKTNPVKFIGHPVCEPGNMASILNANYIDGPKNKLDFALIADYFSQADVIEDAVFAGGWELLPYFNLFGCVLPAVAIGHTLKPPLKPGSSWTKYQNICMRNKKIKAMSHRVPRLDLDLDALMLLRDKAEAGDYELLKEYGIQPQDVDVMSHLSPLRKLKPKALSTIKKWLSQSSSPSSSS